MAIFYVKNVSDGVNQLPEDESRHCFQVLRHVSGDEITLFDGIGGKHRAILDQVSKKSCTFSILSSEIEPQKKFYVHLAIAPTKNSDRMEWMIEKLGEIGVDEITFIQTQHSERKHLRLDRLEKKAISAMKQSGSPWKLKINELVHYPHFLDAVDADQKFIAHVNKDHDYLGAITEQNTTTTLLIGPEGDFSEKELNLAIDKGFIPVSLGENTLRTETAGFVACCLVNARNQV